MLQAINDRAKGIVGAIIVLFLTITFASWGIQEYLTGGKEKYAASVNGVDIAQTDVDRETTRLRQRYQELFKGNLPQDPSFEKRIKDQALEQLITRELLKQAIVSEHYRVSDQALAKSIASNAAFQQEGQFLVSLYRDRLKSQGLTTADFEHLYRFDLAVQQLQDGIRNTAFPGNYNATLIAGLQKQQRQIAYLKFKLSSYLNNIQVSDKEIQQYYDEHKQRFMKPEQVSVAYVEIKGSDLKSQIPVDQKALRRLYDEYLAKQSKNEQRKAKHILITLDTSADEKTQQAKKKLIEDIQAKLKSGVPFEKLAKEYSQDPGSASKGGELGWMDRGMMPSAFDDALFKLEKGQLSGIVKSSFGYHIIKLEDINAPKPESFDSMKKKLADDSKKQDLDNLFYEQSEQLANVSYENDQSLDPVVDAMGLKIQHSGLFTRASGTGIASSEKVRQAAFDNSVLKEGVNSPVIELGENHVVVLRVDQHIASTARPLDEVQAQVVTAIKQTKAREKAMSDSLKALAEVQQGKPLQDLAGNPHVEYKKDMTIKRDTRDVEASIVQKAFDMRHPDAGKAVYDSVELRDGVAIIKLDKVIQSDAAPAADDVHKLASQMQTELARRELAAVIDYYREKSDITRAKVE